MSLVDDAMDQIAKLFKENQELRAELAAANERAETAEAQAGHLAGARKAYDRMRTERDDALARLAELGEVRIEWSIRWIEDGAVSGEPHTEAEARERAGANPKTMTLVRRLVTDWRDAEPADATAAAPSATQTDAERAQAREDTNFSTPQGPQEATG